MRVLIIGPARSIALEQWVTEMRSRGHSIAVLSPDTPRQALSPITETTEAGPRIPLVRFVARVLRIRHKVRSLSPDVVHGHGAVDYGLWAVLSGHPRVLVTCWGSDVLVQPQRLRSLRRKVVFALRHADYVTATSETLLAAARRVAGRNLPGEALSWGVDTAVFRPAETVRDDTRVVFLSLRALEPLYNIETIVRAFARLASGRSDVELVIAGRGSQADELVELACSLGIADCVRFAGWVEQDELPEFYRSADVYVSVPSSDASAVSNMEAMASGLGMIVGDLPSTREWVRPDTDGLAVVPGDVDSLYAAMGQMESNPELRQRLGASARERIVAIGQRKQLMDRASELYADLAAGIVGRGGG